MNYDDSGHGFEQCDFTNSPMSEYGPLGKNRQLYILQLLLTIIWLTNS